MIDLRAFGGLELRLRGGPVLQSVLAQPKRMALLCYLTLARPGAFHRRDTLLALFWPESDTEHARASLRQSVHVLRRSLGEEAVCSRGDEELGLAEGVLSCDVLDFEAALAAGDLERALTLYAGDLLPGFFIEGAPEFERWLDAERTRLRDRAVQACWTLAERCERAADGAAAAQWGRRALALAPVDDALLLRLMQLLVRAGDRAGALAAFDAHARQLWSEFQIEPPLEARALAEQLRKWGTAEVPESVRQATSAAVGAGAPAAPPAASAPVAAAASPAPVTPPAPAGAGPARHRALTYAGIAVAYVTASGGVLQLADVLQNRLGLPSWFFPATLVLLCVGAVVVLGVAAMQGAPWLLTSRDREVTPRPLPVRLRPHWPARLLTWRNLAMAGAGGFSLLGIATGGYMGMRVAGIGPAGTLIGRGVLHPRDRLVLADMENRTGDLQLGAVVTEAVRTQLEQSTAVQVVQPPTIRETLVLMKQDTARVLSEVLAREVALRLGAKAVVTGTVGTAGSGYVLTAHVVIPDSAEPLVSVLQTAANAGELIPALDALSVKLRERIGESLHSIRASPPLAQVTTSSLPALRLYTEADRLNLNRRKGLGFEQALSLLRRAISLDTGFASAYRLMGSWFYNSGAHQSEMLDAYHQALQRSGRLPVAERYLLHGTYDLARGNRDSAAEAFRTLLDVDAEDVRALNLLGLVYDEQADYVRADSFFARALQLMPMDPARQNHAMVLISLGRFDSARAYLPTHDLSQPLAVATVFLKAAAEPPDSVLAFTRRNDPGLQRAPSVYESAALWSMGRVHEAERRGEPLASPLEPIRLFGQMSRVQWRVSVLGDGPLAAHMADSALARFDLAGMPMMERPYLVVAYTFALAGRPAVARRMLGEYRAALAGGNAIPEPSFEKLAVGAIALTDRRYADAVTELRQAHDLPIPNNFLYRRCRACTVVHLAQAYDALGQRDSAIAVYERFLQKPERDRVWAMTWVAPTHERLAELYEIRGDRKQAAAHASAFVKLWEHADPELQPRVAAMRRRLAVLQPDRPRP